MSIDLYFKSVEEISFEKGTVGSNASIYHENFPDWESADVVVLSVMRIEEMLEMNLVI